MVKKIKELYVKYKEIINYLIFGGLSTIVNFVIYFIANDKLNIEELISNIIAWFFSVLFAYITNKLFVFNSKTTTKNEALKEMISFFSCRILTLLITDIAIFAILVKVLKINDYIVKIINQVLVVILNYVFSKLVIFKKK